MPKQAKTFKSLLIMGAAAISIDIALPVLAYADNTAQTNPRPRTPAHHDGPS